MRNIFIPLELNHSKLEDKIIETAISHAKQLKSKCWLVCVNQSNDLQEKTSYLNDYTLADIKEEQRKLQLVVDLFDEHKINNEALFIQASSIDFLQKKIKTLNIDLLIMGNSSSYFNQLLPNGTTVEESINEINLPTLIIPSHE